MSVFERDQDDTNPGHSRRPDGVETIDRIKAACIARWGERLGEIAFIGYCMGSGIKYRYRAGKKGSTEGCLEKARWHEQMDLSQSGVMSDPREVTAYKDAAEWDIMMRVMKRAR